MSPKEVREMFKSLEKVNWNLLDQQKSVLLNMRKWMVKWTGSERETEALSGVIHLLDKMQDEAVEAGLWTFPKEVLQ